MLPSISIIGGTGAEGSGLALRWAYSGYQVTIGSRTLDKALEKAAELNIKIPDTKLQLVGEDNLTAVKASQIVVLTVPYSAHRETLLDLKAEKSCSIITSKFLDSLTELILLVKIFSFNLISELTFS